MNFSRFGDRFTQESGILQLMDDLGSSLSSHQDTLMLGGGNPAHIPAVQQHFRQRVQRLLGQDDRFERCIGNYDNPQGNRAFITALVPLLNRRCGWDIRADNVALTTGSQSSFFYLFNLLAGTFADGRKKKILFPMTPEYIGYADLGLEPDLFVANRPAIEYLESHRFKYRVDFSRLRIDDSIAALCVSRPSNPTGNVLTDAELEQLAALAAQHEVPLILDSAYGLPFPGIVFTDAKPFRQADTIVCMSLSKLGLPGTRTGIVIAPEAVIRTLSRMNAILNLSPGSIGPVLAQTLVESGEIISLSETVIRPFYQEKARAAVGWLQKELAGLNYYIHEPEGAIFLWLWLKDLPISCETLYQRLKQRGVLVVPGHYFFPGLGDEPWQHKQECIRISYAQPEDTVQRGLVIIAEEVRKAYRISA